MREPDQAGGSIQEGWQGRWNRREKSQHHALDHRRFRIVSVPLHLPTVSDEAEDNAREKNQLEKYSTALEGVNGLENRLTSFAAIRSGEGYLAEWKKEGDTYFFIENHCPICCAANECDNICTSEMRTFVSILGEELNVSRMEHIINGARRCVYKIETI